MKRRYAVLALGRGTGGNIVNVYFERLKNGEENITEAEKIVGVPCYAMASHLVQLLPAWKIENASGAGRLLGSPFAEVTGASSAILGQST